MENKVICYLQIPFPHKKIFGNCELSKIFLECEFLDTCDLGVYCTFPDKGEAGGLYSGRGTERYLERGSCS